MEYSFPIKPRLSCPGPTTVPLDSALAGLHTEVYHRSPEFKEEVLKSRQLLQPFFGSTELPLLLSASGSGAMEAAMQNLSCEGDKVLVINGGKFGDRWAKLSQAYACDLVEMRLPWGHSVDMDALEDILKKNKDIRAVFFQGNETSTGVAYPTEKIAKLIREICPDALVVVDAISALVAHKIEMAAWDIDCLLSGSQKGFGVPPGLSFISLSDRAWSRISTRQKFYFDLEKERKGQETGTTAWTPPVSLINTLNGSLERLSLLGVDTCVQYHQDAAQICRHAIQAIGLKLFSQKDHSQALTAIQLPASIDGVKFNQHVKNKYGISFAGGQDEAKGKIVRVAHLGIFDVFDVLSNISALELALTEFGYSFDLGSGTKAAMTKIRT